MFTLELIVSSRNANDHAVSYMWSYLPLIVNSGSQNVVIHKSTEGVKHTMKTQAIRSTIDLVVVSLLDNVYL